MDELISEFRKVATICTFLGQTNGQIDAYKLKISLETLAKFKYLLPHDIVFEYQEKPQNVHRDSTPETILVFEFTKKLQASQKLIESRNNKFHTALQQFCSRRDLGHLDELAKIPEEPTEIKAKKEIGSSSLDSMIDSLERISVARRSLPPREAIYSDKPIPENIQKVMAKKGLKRLYSHQYEGIDALSNGLNLVISTPTASGKTFIFQAPIVSCLDCNKEATALFIYPTKALAQDQLQIFQRATDVLCGTFDGDTNITERDVLRQNARAIFSNPDILHYTVLPNWPEWEPFLSNLEFIVIDEVHIYEGVFGAHVGMILRRLRRICAQLGNESVQFICCSATIQNPLRLVHDLTGINIDRFKLIDKDGSPSAGRHYFFVQSITQENPDQRGRPLRVSAPIFVSLASAGYKTIAFCKYRKECELLMKGIRSTAGDDKTLLDKIMAYRGGYSPEQRRKIEKDMFHDKLQGIIATSALEVGIDIGSLDAVVICGFPKSFSSLRQQVGRVGRRDRESIVVYVGGGEVRDQTYINHPDLIFEAQDPFIPLSFLPSLIEAHCHCSARELALCEDDFQFFKFDCFESVVKTMAYENGLYHCGVKWLPNPARQINIRHIEEENTAIIDVTDNRNVLLETIESFRVGFTVYPGAIYIYQGLPHLVVDLDENLLYAKVIRTNVKWHTRQRDYTDVDPIKPSARKVIAHNCTCFVGSIKLKTVVFGYFKFDERNRILEAHELTLPPVLRTSNGLWVDIPTSTLEVLSDKKLHAGAAIHGAEHVFLKSITDVIPVALGDMRTECKAPEKELAKVLTTRQRPARLIFYERYVGDDTNYLWKRVLDNLDTVIDKSMRLLDDCKCEDGCANCTGHPFCQEKNIILSKRGAKVIFRMMTGRNVDDILDGPEEHLKNALKGTVIPIAGI